MAQARPGCAVGDEKAWGCCGQCDCCRLSERHASEMRRALQEQQSAVSQLLDGWLEQMGCRTQPAHLSGKGAAVSTEGKVETVPEGPEEAPAPHQHRHQEAPAPHRHLRPPGAGQSASAQGRRAVEVMQELVPVGFAGSRCEAEVMPELVPVGFAGSRCDAEAIPGAVSPAGDEAVCGVPPPRRPFRQAPPPPANSVSPQAEEAMPARSPPKSRRPRLAGLLDAGGASQNSSFIVPDAPTSPGGCSLSLGIPFSEEEGKAGAGSPSSAAGTSQGEDPRTPTLPTPDDPRMLSVQGRRPGKMAGSWSLQIGRTLGAAVSLGSRLSDGDEAVGHHKVKYNMKFELLSSLVLLIDAVCMGYQVDESLKLGYELHASDDADPQAARPTHWQVFEVCFVSYYTLELVTRGVRERTAFVFGPGRFWNFFDLLSVIVSIVGVFLAKGGSGKIPRLFRIAKGVRVLRTMRFSGSLRAMVFAITSSLVSLFWALCVMFLIMYFFSVVFVTAIADTLERTPVSGDSGPDVSAFLPYYKSLFDTTLHLFMSITGGINWQLMAVPLLDVDPLLMCMFVFYICFMVFGVLNVVVGLFVSKAKEAVDRDRDILTENRLREDRETMRRMRDIFHEADTDGDNTLSWDEFEKYLTDSRAAVFLSSLGLDVNVAQALFVLLDVDDDDSVSIEEFVAGCIRLKGEARSIDVNMLLYQSEKMQRQFMECMDSLGRELSRLGGALDLSPCEVATEKVRTSVRRSQIGLAALSRARCSISRGDTNISTASQGSRFIHNVIHKAGRRLFRKASTLVQPVRLQGR